MRFVYFIILGLIVFNSVLILTSPIFNTDMDIDENDYDKYALKNPNNALDLLFSSTALNAWGSFTVIAAIGIIAAIIVKNYVIAGVAVFLGLVTGLYIGASDILFRISDNVYVSGIITLIGIVIGILVLYDLVGIITFQGRES